MPTRPTIFKWRQTELALILCAVRWYLRYPLSLRDFEELLEERGLPADHTIDFSLPAPDADAAKRLFRNALSDLSHSQPRVINTDLAVQRQNRFINELF